MTRQISASNPATTPRAGCGDGVGGSICANWAHGLHSGTVIGQASAITSDRTEWPAKWGRGASKCVRVRARPTLSSDSGS